MRRVWRRGGSGLATFYSQYGIIPWSRYSFDAIAYVVRCKDNEEAASGIACVQCYSACPVTLSNSLSEEDCNDAFCASVGGRTETRRNCRPGQVSGHVKADCETDNQVYEGGLEKRSSLDSVPQALFFSVLSGKEPVAVICNTAGESGKIEDRINLACGAAGVKFLNISLDEF